MARRMAHVAAAMTMVVLAACGGSGSDESAAPAGSSTPASPPRVELRDLAEPPSAAPASFEAPMDLPLPDEAWREEYQQVARRLSTMLRTSTDDSRTWQLTSDKAAYQLVYGGFDVTPTSGSQVADALYEQARDKALPGERIARKIASVFPADAAPRDVFVYKVGWDAHPDGPHLRVTAQAWVGYDVGADTPILVARELGVTIKRAGAGYSYRVAAPKHGTYASSCSATVDGVLRAPTGTMRPAAIEAWKSVVGDPAVRPMMTAFREVAAAADADISDAKSRASAKECLAEAAGTS